MFGQRPSLWVVESGCEKILHLQNQNILWVVMFYMDKVFFISFFLLNNYYRVYFSSPWENPIFVKESERIQRWEPLNGLKLNEISLQLTFSAPVNFSFFSIYNFMKGSFFNEFHLRGFQEIWIQNDSGKINYGE